MGTPWAKTWDGEWAASVEQNETQLGLRICGAKTLAGTPCTLTSDHRTGRCPFHGGAAAIGAPVGNTNAQIHVLYARRVQRCGAHCPMWDHCPFAKPEVLALDPKERPNCAYETAEYDRVIEEITGNTPPELQDRNPLPNQEMSTPSISSTKSTGHDPTQIPGGAQGFRTHNLALLQVMVSRAAAALSVATFTGTVTSKSDRYHLESTKVHAALEAFLRLAREHRATLKNYEQTENWRTGGASSSNTCAASVGLAGHPATTELTPENAEILSNFTHTNPNTNSFAEFIQPLLEAGEGVMEEAMAAETERKNYTRHLERVLQEEFGGNWREKIEPTAQPP